MKISLEDHDVKAIAMEICNMLSPVMKTQDAGREEDVVFDVPGLAEYLRVEHSWIYKQVQFKTIPYFKAGKYTRFKKTAIDRWIEAQAVRPVERDFRK